MPLAASTFISTMGSRRPEEFIPDEVRHPETGAVVYTDVPGVTVNIEATADKTVLLSSNNNDPEALALVRTQIAKGLWVDESRIEVTNAGVFDLGEACGRRCVFQVRLLCNTIDQVVAALGTEGDQALLSSEVYGEQYLLNVKRQVAKQLDVDFFSVGIDYDNWEAFQAEETDRVLLKVSRRVEEAVS